MAKKGKKDTDKNSKASQKTKDIILRYILLLIVSIPGFYFFQWIFQPLTEYPVYWILNFIYGATLDGSTVLIEGVLPIEIVGACVAGSAYLLFLILNLSTPNIGYLKRLKLLGVAFGSFLIINILRILVLSFMIVAESSSFDFVHSFFWYFLSTIFVVGVWFFEVKKFNIKDVPFYSDIRFLLKHSRK